MREIGERAVNLLLAIIEGVDVPLQQTLEFRLMVRGSTAAPRAFNSRDAGPCSLSALSNESRK
jgi:hypothetical protein